MLRVEGRSDVEMHKKEGARVDQGTSPPIPPGLNQLHSN